MLLDSDAFYIFASVNCCVYTKRFDEEGSKDAGDMMGI